MDYVVAGVDGRQFSGILATESSNSITLVAQDGKTQTVLRSEIDELRATGKSLMPEGIEKDIAPRQLADIFAYVRSQGPPRKQFEGNEPQIAPVRDDGSIRLLAMHARIYGPTLVFEPKYRNLGWWQSPQDYAAWDIQVPRQGRYRVSLEYACENSAAGDRFLLSVNGQTIGERVEGTGSWDDYRSKGIGTVELPKGRVELIVRADGPIHSALIDLRTIVLVPQ
jgi:hypothetical protein